MLKRISLCLDEEQYQYLTEKAKMADSDISKLVRRAVHIYITKDKEVHTK